MADTDWLIEDYRPGGLFNLEKTGRKLTPVGLATFLYLLFALVGSRHRRVMRSTTFTYSSCVCFSWVFLRFASRMHATKAAMIIRPATAMPAIAPVDSPPPPPPLYIDNITYRW